MFVHNIAKVNYLKFETEHHFIHGVIRFDMEIQPTSPSHWRLHVNLLLLTWQHSWEMMASMYPGRLIWWPWRSWHCNAWLWDGGHKLRVSKRSYHKCMHLVHLTICTAIIHLWPAVQYPKSAYAVFQQDPKVKSGITIEPGQGVGELSKKYGEAWKKVSDTEKAKWVSSRLSYPSLYYHIRKVLEVVSWPLNAELMPTTKYRSVWVVVLFVI